MMFNCLRYKIPSPLTNPERPYAAPFLSPYTVDSRSWKKKRHGHFSYDWATCMLRGSIRTILAKSSKQETKKDKTFIMPLAWPDRWVARKDLSPWLIKYKLGAFMTYTEIRSEPRQKFFCDKKSIYYILIFVAITWFKRFFTISGASDLIAGTSGGRQLATASWTWWIKKQSFLFQRNGIKTGTKCL